MNQRAKTVAERIKSFSDEVIAFVEKSSDADWMKTCDWEQWSMGVTARHLGAAHLSVFNLADMILKGQALPPLNMDQINESAKKDAQAHAGCSRAEALDELHKNSAKMVAFVSGLNDDDLDRKGSMPAFGGDVSVEQLIDYVIFISAAKHFKSMQTAVAT
ncbi:MAG: DinB family protein [Desulfobacteraceae bacterium]|nr:MAG: DinB family protein [Desulfobacteraceae bacterium]